MAKILTWRDVGGRNAFHAARAVRKASSPFPYHGHDFAELFWIDSGVCLHQIKRGTVTLRPGDLVLMRPTDFHGIAAREGETLAVTNIAFSRETLDFLRDRYFRGKNWAFDPAAPDPLTQHIEPSRLRRFNRWADELSQSPRERLYLERFLLNVLAELSLDRDEVPPEGTPDWLEQACRALQKPESFSAGVEAFFRLCGRSREHVSRTVRQHLGMTPTDYVNVIRMTYAKRQLEMGGQSILDIALDCGIGNLSHFYILFKAHTGTTPRNYRIAHRKPL